MADDFLNKKWAHVFDGFFDLDGSKSVEWDDLELLLKKVESAHGAGSAQHDATKQAMSKVWDGLIAYDEDGDAEVSKEEWKMMWTAFMDGKPQACDWQTAYMEFMFKLLDVDGDGKINASDFYTAMSYFNVSDQDARMTFDKLCGGVVMQRSEFEKLWKEYFTSTDPSAKGNAFFGALKA